MESQKKAEIASILSQLVQSPVDTEDECLEAKLFVLQRIEVIERRLGL